MIEWGGGSLRNCGEVLARSWREGWFDWQPFLHWRITGCVFLTFITLVFAPASRLIGRRSALLFYDSLKTADGCDLRNTKDYHVTRGKTIQEQSGFIARISHIFSRIINDLTPPERLPVQWNCKPWWLCNVTEECPWHQSIHYTDIITLYFNIALHWLIIWLAWAVFKLWQRLRVFANRVLRRIFGP
jgi:hypothetical protein